MRGRVCQFLLSAWGILASLEAHGETPSSPSAAAPTTAGTSPEPPGETAAPAPAPYWSEGPARPFVAGRAFPGFGYARFELATGYGKPHWMWAGLDAAGVVAPMYAAVQAGLHAKVVLVDLTLVVRRTYSFGHTLVPVNDSLRSVDLEQPGRDRAVSNVIEASASGFLPHGRWLLTWELTYVRPLGLSDSELLYEEIQRIVIANQGVVTSKLGPMVNLASTRDLYLGLLVEHLSLLGRRDGLVFRLGPTFWTKLSNRWSLFCYFTLPVHGPDRLGAWEGMYGAGGFVYRFATGETLGRRP